MPKSKTKKIAPSVPVIAETPKVKTAKVKPPTMGRTEHAATIAGTSPGGWSIMSKEPTLYPFTCVCNGKGKKGYELVAVSPVDELTGPAWATEWVTDGDLARVKVGASCLYHFGIAL